MTSKNFDRGRSTGEREGTPAYGGPDEASRVSGGGIASLGIGPDHGLRNEPIAGHGTMAPAGRHSARLVDGTDVVLGPTNREVQGVAAERMAQTMSLPQLRQADLVRRGGATGKRDFPDGGHVHGDSLNKIVVGRAYARPGPSGHDPGDDEASGDYLHDQDPLAKYGTGILSARSVLGPGQDYGSGYPAFPAAHSQFPVMNEDILEGFAARTAAISSNYIPSARPARPSDPRKVGQPLRRGRKGR